MVARRASLVLFAVFFAVSPAFSQQWGTRTIGTQQPLELAVGYESSKDGEPVTNLMTLSDDGLLQYARMAATATTIAFLTIATQSKEIFGLAHNIVTDFEGNIYFGFIDAGQAVMIKSSNSGQTWTRTVLGNAPVYGEMEVVLTPFGITVTAYNAQTHRVDIFGFSLISHEWISLGTIPSGNVHAGVFGGPRVALIGDKKDDRVYVGWGEQAGGRVFYCFRPFSIPALTPLGPAVSVPLTFSAESPTEVRAEISGDRLAMIGAGYDGNYTLGVTNLTTGFTRTVNFGKAPAGTIGGADVAFAGSNIYATYVAPSGLLKFSQVNEHAFGLEQTELPAIEGGWPSLPPALPIDLDTFGGRGETMRLRTFFPGSVRMAEYSGCANSRSRLCVTNHRFEVSATWEDHSGNTGRARAVPVSGDTGYFWFFDDANIELMVKVLNGCGVNQRQWVFAGGLTDVKVDITVRDTVTGAEKTYHNARGTKFQPIQDTSAFAGCSSGSQMVAQSEEELREEIAELPGVELSCATTGTSLCLAGNRFRLEAAWETKDGARGSGRAVKLTDDSGYFWFFDKANVELITKVLNGCGVNGQRWVFGAGLTDVRVDLTVTDTVTGSVRQYSNSQGTKFLPIQDTGAFASCP